jgi:hypothetical protein
MTEQEKEFLRLHVINQIKLVEVAALLNLSSKTLSLWYEQLRDEREAITKIRKLWLRKRFSCEFEVFYYWLAELERKCEYCGITEGQIKALLDKDSIYTKRLLTRGKNLELDRKVPERGYDDIGNIVLCCYWCNNAKTDEFSYEEFKPIGKVLEQIWKRRLA